MDISHPYSDTKTASNPIPIVSEVTLLETALNGPYGRAPALRPAVAPVSDFLSPIVDHYSSSRSDGYTSKPADAIQLMRPMGDASVPAALGSHRLAENFDLNAPRAASPTPQSSFQPASIPTLPDEPETMPELSAPAGHVVVNPTESSTFENSDQRIPAHQTYPSRRDDSGSSSNLPVPMSGTDSIAPSPATPGAGRLLSPSTPNQPQSARFSSSGGPPTARLYSWHQADGSARPSRDINRTSMLDDNVTDRNSPMSFARPRVSLNLSGREPHPFPGDQTDDEGAIRDGTRQRRTSRRKRRDSEDDDRVVMGTKVDQNHVNWVTAYNMLTGIRYTVSRTNAKIDRSITAEDFETTNKFSFDITGNELTPSAKYDFKFKDYAPWVFRRLRATFQLDPADYLMSLTSKYILSELGSPGKSGSFFYFSRDYKYIIKTIHRGEHKFLRKILRRYYDHAEAYPNTLLSQFYGLHRVKMPYGRKIHFVVMNNLFPPHRDIHQTFDLKGSTIGREYPEDKVAENPRATLKDLNFVRYSRYLEFGPDKREAFLKQLNIDVRLLQDLHVMDYSLLVGIHDLDKGNEEQLRDKTLQVFQPTGEDDENHIAALARTPSTLEKQSKARELRQKIRHQRPVPLRMPDELGDESRRHHFFYCDDGGIRATHEDNTKGDEIYYLGIIDCLTHYGVIKRMEHFLKGITKVESQLSAIPPFRYGERFLRFITGVAVSKEVAQRREAEVNWDSLSPLERVKLFTNNPIPSPPTDLASPPLPDPSLLSPNAQLPVVDEAGELPSEIDVGPSNHVPARVPSPSRHQRIPTGSSQFSTDRYQVRPGSSSINASAGHRVPPPTPPKDDSMFGVSAHARQSSHPGRVRQSPHILDAHYGKSTANKTLPPPPPTPVLARSEADSAGLESRDGPPKNIYVSDQTQTVWMDMPNNVGGVSLQHTEITINGWTEQTYHPKQPGFHHDLQPMKRTVQ